MQIKTLADLEKAKKLIKKMRKEATHPFVISVYDEMLKELDKGDPENMCTPSYLSIVYFSYDIFRDLHRI
jgi:hypothetical protein